MTNITDMFSTSNEIDADDETVHNYNYEIVTIEDEVFHVQGYIVLNQLFIATAKDEGILQWGMPFERLKTFKNLGPVDANKGNFN